MIRLISALVLVLPLARAWSQTFGPNEVEKPFSTAALAGDIRFTQHVAV